MTPRCTAPECHQPVHRKVTSTPSALGERIVNGERWCWYCSRACSGRQQGLRAAREGRVLLYAAPLRIARLRAAEIARQALYAEDVTTFKRYGVPSSLALAILGRVYQRAERHGYQRAYYRLHGKYVVVDRRVARERHREQGR